MDEEERKVLLELDPASIRMTVPHQHQVHRAEQLNGLSRQRQTCVCGAHRDTGLVNASGWIGGEEQETPWQRAHLEAVRRAVEQNPPLLALQPGAIQDLHRAIANDPPQGAEKQDLEALTTIYRMAQGAARRMLEWQQQESGGNAGEE